MTAAEAIARGFRKYADFSGRATRAEFWWWLLFTVAGASVFGLFEVVFGRGLLAVLFVLALLMPTSAVTSRRLHDIGKSAWWKLAWLVATLPAWLASWALALVTLGRYGPWNAGGDPGVVGLAPLDWRDIEPLTSSLPTVIVIAATTFVTLAVVGWQITWLARQGDTGSNRFGPDPRG